MLAKAEVVPTDEPKPTRAAFDQAVNTLRETAKTLADSLEAAAGEALLADIDAYISAVESVVDEILPRHRTLAAKVEMVREKLRMVEAARRETLRAEDMALQGLLNEIDLTQRELNAALSDGLEAEAQRKRQMLALRQDRLVDRQAELEERVRQDPAVVAAREALAQTEEVQLAVIRKEQVETAERLRQLLAAAQEQAMGEAGAPLRKALSALETLGQRLVAEQAERSDVLSEMWLPEPQTQTLLSFEPGLQPVLHENVQPELNAEPASASLNQLEAEMARLRREIEQREAELAGQVQSELTQLRQELTAAEAAAKKASEEAQRARSELSDLKSGRSTAERQRQRLGELRARKTDRELAIGDMRNELSVKRQQLEQLAVPQPPSDADVVVPPVEDNRMEMILYSLAGIATVFLGIIYFTLRSAARG